MQALRSEGPGPGAYEHEESKTGPQYSMGGRGGAYSGDSSPGPGSYKSVGHLGGPQYSIGGRSGADDPADVPGPGAYERRGDIPPPAWSFGSKHAEKQESNPGPGQYSPEASQRSSPGTLISQLERQSREITDSPGPGAYNIESHTSTQKYSFSKATRTGKEEEDFRGGNVPASVPNAPKYLLPPHILDKYSIDKS